MRAILLALLFPAVLSAQTIQLEVTLLWEPPAPEDKVTRYELVVDDGPAVSIPLSACADGRCRYNVVVPFGVRVFKLTAIGGQWRATATAREDLRLPGALRIVQNAPIASIPGA